MVLAGIPHYILLSSRNIRCIALAPPKTSSCEVLLKDLDYIVLGVAQGFDKYTPEYENIPVFL